MVSSHYSFVGKRPRGCYYNRMRLRNNYDHFMETTGQVCSPLLICRWTRQVINKVNSIGLSYYLNNLRIKIRKHCDSFRFVIETELKTAKLKMWLVQLNWLFIKTTLTLTTSHSFGTKHKDKFYYQTTWQYCHSEKPPRFFLVLGNPFKELNHILTLIFW